MKTLLLNYKFWVVFIFCSSGLISFSHGNATVTAIEKMEVEVQEITVTGTVTSEEDNTPIPGVSILVKGTTTGTITDAEGKYSLSVDEEATLIFSVIGYTTMEVPVESRSTIDIAMATDILSLSEIVVTGYTTQERRDITGAVSTVQAKDIVAIPAGNAEQQLQGRVSGVTVITSGVPGSSSLVRVRGFGSFTSNAPLYIVDGVPTGDISFINSGDIETTTILKDAGAASIYGSRASAGVVIITTKKGKPGEMKVTYDASYGTQNPGDGHDLLNPRETADATWIALRNSIGGVDPNTGNPTHTQYGNGEFAILPDYILPAGAMESEVDFSLYNPDPDNYYGIYKANKSGTDYYDAITNPSPIQNHTLGVAGGSENSRYYVGLGYYDQQGVVNNTYLKRYTLRANTEFTIKDRIKIGENFQVSYRQQPPGAFNNLNEGNAISFAYRQNPLVPIYDIEGNYAGSRAPGFSNPQNPVANQDRIAHDKSFNTMIFGNVYAEADLFDGLSVRSSFGGGFGNYHAYNYTYRTYENSENNATNSFSERSGYSYNWVWTNTAKFEKKFDIHQIAALAGVEANLIGAGRAIGGGRLGYFTDNPDYRTLNAGEPSGLTNFGNATEGTRLFSYFTKVDYSIFDKYLLSATLRYDGSSNFSTEKRYGLFPAVTGAWRISDESFLDGAEFLDDLKIRAGWGKMGNQAIPEGNAFGAFAASPAFSAYDIHGTSTSTVPGFYRTRLGNPMGSWETNTTTNVGLDATLFNNSLQVMVDVYKKTTSDLLYNPEIGAIHGYLGVYPYINIAEMENRGIDLQIIKKGRIASDWSYNANLTFSRYVNEIKAVSSGSDEFPGPSFGSSRIGTFTLNKVGNPISAFYGYKVEGIFQSESEIDALDKSSPTNEFQESAAPGRFRYADVDGDGVITTEDRTIFGDPNPDFTYGLNLLVGYKNFDLEAFFYGSQGNDIINYTRWFTDFYSTWPGSALHRRALYESWSEENPSGTTPILEDASNFSTSGVANSYYMEDGSYFRLRNIQLGYTLPSGLIEKYGIDKLKVYLQATNLFTLTNYSGLDPSISGVDTNFGVDYGNYPFVKQYLLGVNISF